MPSLIQELNEALDLWASLLPTRATLPTTANKEKRETEAPALRVPDSLPLLQSVGPFFQQAAWLGESQQTFESTSAEPVLQPSPQQPIQTPIQHSVSAFFQNANWSTQAKAIPEQAQEPKQESSRQQVSHLPNDSGVRLSVQGFFQNTAWNNASSAPSPPKSEMEMDSEEANTTDVTHFFEDIRW